MPRYHKPRRGSMQFWPRSRAKKTLPRVNWKPLETNSTKNGVLGFIGYKVGMASAIIKDNTPNSLSKNKQIVIPVSIIECPPMKVLAVRFYKGDNVAVDVLAENLDKELKRKIKVPKKFEKKLDNIKLEEYDNIRLLVYTLVKNTGVKKTPDIAEIGLKGSMQEKLNLAKELMKREIKISEVFEKGKLIDTRSVTKGKGLAGPVKRFGIALKSHKSEKGQRRPGSLGPWHPARVSYRVPLAGQLGFFSRVKYNDMIVDIGSISEKNINIKSGFRRYGVIKNDYILLKGSVGGSKKRAIFLTQALRPTKKKVKQNFEIIKVE